MYVKFYPKGHLIIDIKFIFFTKDILISTFKSRFKYSGLQMMGQTEISFFIHKTCFQRKVECSHVFYKCLVPKDSVRDLQKINQC